MIEQWKDIPDFEGRYQVSDQGRVKALFQWCAGHGSGYYKEAERIIKPRDDSKGYKFVLLYDGKGARRERRVNRLVAAAFCPPREGCNEVNHLNLNKGDNRAVNLEWCSHSENIRHAIAHGVKVGRPRKAVTV